MESDPSWQPSHQHLLEKERSLHLCWTSGCLSAGEKAVIPPRTFHGPCPIAWAAGKYACNFKWKISTLHLPETSCHWRQWTLPLLPWLMPHPSWQMSWARSSYHLNGNYNVTVSSVIYDGLRRIKTGFPVVLLSLSLWASKSWPFSSLRNILTSKNALIAHYRATTKDNWPPAKDQGWRLWQPSSKMPSIQTSGTKPWAYLAIIHGGPFANIA